LPEWLIERGIGETRAALVEAGEIIEARIAVEGAIAAGSILEARLKTVGRNAIAIAGRQEFLLPRGAPGITAGSKLRIEVTREALGGLESWKRPLARYTEEAERAGGSEPGRELSFPAPNDELEQAGWYDLLDEARSGIVRFQGGELRISVTPAMTLIDVDGTLDAGDLAVAGAAAAARTIRRHSIGGSIGVDLPTSGDKPARLAAAAAVDGFLPKPFERTAVNGFGFLQIVRPRARASLFEHAMDRAPFEARALLRAASREHGAIRLVAPPAITTLLQTRQEWLLTLSRHVGGQVTLRSDPGLAMSAGYVENA
jgi:hypothetical protein